MPYLQTHKLPLTICLILGFTIAIFTRASLATFTTDFSYYRIGSFYHPTQFIPSDQRVYMGKSVVGMSGFPFPAYSRCIMGAHGMSITPACDSFFIGEFSIILNTLFWALILYGIITLVLAIKKAARTAHT